MAVLFYLLFILLRLSSSFSSADPLFKTCGGSNYTINGTYNSNLHNLLNFFTSLNSTSFANRTEGSTPDRVYGLILCRGDVNSSDCTSCIQNAAKDILSLCPGSKQATIWYDNCELRYSDLRFFSTFGITNPLTAYNSPLMFATGTATNGIDVTVNGLAQCTRDLSKDGCSQCLKQIRDVYTTKYMGERRLGGRVLVESCNFRYEVYPFFQGNPTVLLNLTASLPPSPPPPAPTSAGGEGCKSNTGKVLSIVIPLVAVNMMLTIGMGIFVFFGIKRYIKRYVKKSISGDD